MKAVIPLLPFCMSVLAYTTRVDAVGPFVILHAGLVLVCHGTDADTHQNLLPFNL
jgi:hypothetical protein